MIKSDKILIDDFLLFFQQHFFYSIQNRPEAGEKKIEEFQKKDEDKKELNIKIQKRRGEQIPQTIANQSINQFVFKKPTSN